VTDQLAEIKRDLERGGDAATWPAGAVRFLVGEVERLQRFEAMWEDAKQHRDTAEARARRYQDLLRAIEALVRPKEEPL